MRVFTKLREMMISHKDLAHKIEELERKYDKQFVVVFEAIKQLLKEKKETVAIPSSDYKKTKIGFMVNTRRK